MKKKLGQASNGEYRISVGKHHLNGKVEYKQFRLGKDLNTAERLAAALQTFWENETNHFAGVKVWSPKSIDKAFSLVIGSAPTTLPSAPDSVPQPAAQPVFKHKSFQAPAAVPATITLFEALEMFVETEKERHLANEISKAFADNTRDHITSIKRHIAETMIVIAAPDQTAAERQAQRKGLLSVGVFGNPNRRGIP